jgi:hypothetical protein
MQYKADLAMVRSQNIDITNFEDKMNKFKEGFARNYDLASRKFNEAIDGIDKTIKELDNLTDKDIVKLLGISLSTARLKCAFLSLHTLKKALKDNQL